MDAVMKGASYEHIDPSLVGNKRDIVLSDLSGKANIVEVGKKFGFKVSKDDVRVGKMLKEVEVLEKKGYDIGDLNAEQFLLADKFFGKNKEFFKIDTWKVSSEQRNGEFSESVITGKVDGKERQVVASVKGGPVDALYKRMMLYPWKVPCPARPQQVQRSSREIPPTPPLSARSPEPILPSRSSYQYR